MNELQFALLRDQAFYQMLAAIGVGFMAQLMIGVSLAVQNERATENSRFDFERKDANRRIEKLIESHEEFVVAFMDIWSRLMQPPSDNLPFKTAMLAKYYKLKIHLSKKGITFANEMITIFETAYEQKQGTKEKKENKFSELTFLELRDQMWVRMEQLGVSLSDQENKIMEEARSYRHSNLIARFLWPYN